MAVKVVGLRSEIIFKLDSYILMPALKLVGINQSRVSNIIIQAHFCYIAKWEWLFAMNCEIFVKTFRVFEQILIKRAIVLGAKVHMETKTRNPPLFGSWGRAQWYFHIKMLSLLLYLQHCTVRGGFDPQKIFLW